MFSNTTEQLKAYERLLGVYLAEYMDGVVRTRTVTDTPFEKYKGLVVSLEEAESAFSPAAFVLSEKGMRAAADIWADISVQSREAAEKGAMLPLDRICSAFGFGMTERFAIALAALPLVNAVYEKTFGYICDNVRLTAPSVSLVIELFAGGDASILPALSEKLLKYVFEPHDGNPLCTPLKFRRYFVSLLALGEFPESGFMSTEYLADPGLVCYEEQAEMISRALGSDGRRCICVSGENGSGRRHLVKQCAARSGRSVLMIDFAKYSAAERSSAEKDIVCDLLIKQCCPCIHGVRADSGSAALKELLTSVLKASRSVFVCADSAGNVPVISGTPPLDIRLAELPRSMRSRLWIQCGIPAELAQTAANKYRFTPKNIVLSAERAQEKMKALGMAELSEKLINSACAEVAETAFGGKATLIQSRFTMDDLILPAAEKQQITEALYQIKYRHIVCDRWNFESRLAYGKGLTMLFAGPPGTGKTMAATVVAGELGLPAYRVDISQIMSKYIGETEKSLGEIFDAAEKCSAILFFDETDALFGKRSEIKDSHDKYANVETSFLLQRLENFDGIVLMATNLLQNIDEAFIRRISCIVNFPLPDSEQRLKLWHNMFPDEMPRDDSVDFEYLAGQFELSGAAIKNAVMSAAFLAAAEGAEVNMSHILRAVRKQLSKQGKLLVRDDFGKYSFFFE